MYWLHQKDTSTLQREEMRVSGRQEHLFRRKRFVALDRFLGFVRIRLHKETIRPDVTFPRKDGKSGFHDASNFLNSSLLLM